MKRRGIILSRLFSLVLGAGFLSLGIANGEFRDVLQKAIRVCLECMGIG